MKRAEAIAAYVRSAHSDVRVLRLAYGCECSDHELLLRRLTRPFPSWPFDFQGVEQNRLSCKEIKQLMFGHIVHRRLSSGSPALMQVSNEPKMSSTPMACWTGLAYISNGKFCQQTKAWSRSGARRWPRVPE